MHDVAVVGIGNPLRGDDAAGREVARLVRPRLPASIPVWECLGGAVELLDYFGRARQLYIIDAVGGPGVAGDILQLSDGDAIEESPAASSHGLGLAQAMGLAKALGNFPQSVHIVGIRGERFGMGDAIGPAVREAIGKTVTLIVEKLGGIHA